jgi:hypothetical protein
MATCETCGKETKRVSKLGQCLVCHCASWKESMGTDSPLWARYLSTGENADMVPVDQDAMESQTTLDGINEHDARLIPALYAAIIGAPVERCKLDFWETHSGNYQAVVTYSNAIGEVYYSDIGSACVDKFNAARNLTMRLLMDATKQLG